MAPMPGSGPTDRLIDNAELAGGGSLPGPAALGPLQVEPISLCTLGPCTRYHELRTKVLAMEPLDGSPGELHTTVTRTCYPHAGVEMDLEAPVRECSLWDPYDAPPDPGAEFEGSYPDVLKAFLASWMSTPNPEDPTDGDR